MSVAFTQKQREAIDVERRHLDACVVAGPGSGKTTVLVEYFRRLVEAGIDPTRILAITFTEKAAGNMRKKLAETFQENTPLRASLERAWVSTVHGFCARLLRENAIFAGVDPEFYVTDERESWRMQQESIVEVTEALFAEDPSGVASLLRGLAGASVEDAILSAYDAMRGAGISASELGSFGPEITVSMDEVVEALRQLRRERPFGWTEGQRDLLAELKEAAVRIEGSLNSGDPLEQLRAIAVFKCDLSKLKRGNNTYSLVKRLRDELLNDMEYLLITRHFAAERELLLEILTRFDQAYRGRKRQVGALDFADLEEFAVRLLEENPETRARLRSQFDHVLMDEFQDTNGQQARLLELVRPSDRFYAVGDINQSIFGFRHAEPEVFSAYREKVNGSGRRLVELTDNFRSRTQILSAVETMLVAAKGIEPRPLVAGRTFQTDKAVAVEVIAAVAEDAATALDCEAHWVACRILEMTSAQGEAAEFKDIAVLVRNTEVLAAFTGAFETAGIPHVVNRGRGFYDSREVNDLTHLLRVIANPRDEISLATVLRSPFVEVSDEALLRMRGLGDNLGSVLMRLVPAQGAEFDADDWRKLCRFRDLLRGWRLRREHTAFDRLLLAAIDETGYRLESGARGAANIEKFLAQARDASRHMSLDNFVEEVSLLRVSNPCEPDAPPEDSANTVKIMTVHSAKGLEFPIVFLAAMHKGIDVSLAAVEFSPRHGLGATWTNPVTQERKDDLFQHAIRAGRKRREEEESNRLLYVAMTRAEDHLVLSCSGSGKKPQHWAAVMAANFGVDLAAPRDEVVTRTAPDGKQWQLRVRCVNSLPPALPRPESARSSASVEFLARPVVTGQHDANATVTAIYLFANCPRKYYLANYLGWEGRIRVLEQEDDSSLRANELGTQVHAILAGNPPPDPNPAALAMAETFRRSRLGQRAAHAARLEREFDFMMAVEDLVLTGQIDLWFEEGGEVVLVDYKTDAVSAHDAHLRARDYSVQLRLYAMAVEGLTSRAPDRAYLHFLRPDTVVEVDIAPSLLESPEQAIRDFKLAQDRLEFPLNEGAHCRRCPFFRDLCPAQAGV